MDGISNVSRIAIIQGNKDKVNPVEQATAPTSEQTAKGQPSSAPRQDMESLNEKLKANLLDKYTETLTQLFIERLGDNKLRIDLDDKAGRFVYKAVNVDSGEVTYQFPAEEMLKILSYYRENAAGLVVDREA